MAFECRLCDPPKPHRNAAGLRGHQQFKHDVIETGESGMNNPPSRVAQEIMDLSVKVDEALDMLYEIQESKTIAPGAHQDQDGLITQIAEAVEKRVSIICQKLVDEAEARHPFGFCHDDDCQPCRVERNRIGVDVLNKVEERIPRTKELLADWELMNTPLIITGDAGNELSDREILKGLKDAFR